ncbi:uncharacterized protein LOC112520665 [Cynara cardunculus var. scolymus]|uniref:Transmembrane protein n=1 Tax=Cynara cardunculus var. scolymus TaxID=59895 RepID=A0A103XGT1_CYNCS|nr:uncharacterized protein LOC112520665 [Cynara cardunculus var. scolymus]XP_024984877.1 uncharacterized protein LOC112520665 [Cynara cardunculus var. scolymus]KVH90480.1 hypothetical protein Ccrd_007515 [Cynara cardunculus var. scolymus]
MNDRPPQPPARLIDLRTTTEILKQTTTTIFSTRHHLLIFLYLSFLLLSLRASVENATHSLTSFIDNDPSIKSLLSRIQLPPNPTTITTRQRRRHRPFLQLTRVGTLDDDFFSGDEELDHRFFGSLSKPQLNATSFILDSFDPQLGFSNFVSDNGIRVSETVRSSAKMTFRSIEIIKEEENEVVDDSNQSAVIDGKAGSKTVLQFFLKRFDLEHHDLTALLFLVGALSSSYGFVVLLFVATHAWVHGIIFVLVVNDFLEGYRSFLRTFWNGACLGMKRLSGFIVMRWVVRDALTQLLGVWFFGEIEDQYSIFKIFVRLKFMPFSIVTPWVKGFEKEIYGFMLSWFLLDMFMSFVFAVDAWVAMVDSRKNGREVVKEGCHLLSLMVHPAINLKCLEGIVCGSFARWILLQSFGKLFASAFQSLMEVYFMVAWLMYYFSVKSMDANSSGQPFGRRELEVLLEDVR